MSKKEGILGKFEIKKLTNPDKVIDGMVMEFDDPIAREALWDYASICYLKGYRKLCTEIRRKCNHYKEIDIILREIEYEEDL